MKKEDIITFEEYFMALAILASKRSKDLNTQVGACIIKDKKILSLGYNGSPTDLPDSSMKWEREGDHLETKYPYMVHAEPNAILNYRGNFLDIRDSIMYVTLFPCNECAKLIIQAGISEVIYLEDKYHDTEETIAARWLFDQCGIKYTLYKSNRKDGYKIEINL